MDPSTDGDDIMTKQDHADARQILVNQAASHIRTLTALNEYGEEELVQRVARNVEIALWQVCSALTDYDEEAEAEAADRADRYEGEVLEGVYYSRICGACENTGTIHNCGA
jgi:hypothetical protein